MKNVPLLLGTIIGSIALIFAVGYLFSRTPQSSTPTVDRAVLEANLTHAKGATESARVTVVEFSDFQCPACRAASPLVTQLSQEYAQQVTFAFRHFPLENIHPNARLAAVAAEAAARQNAFWPYHDLLFSKQDEWSTITDRTQLRELFASYAGSLQLIPEQFLEDLAQPELEAAVTADSALAQQLNVNSTPTFFVNGTPTTTVELRASIESLLAGEPQGEPQSE